MKKSAFTLTELAIVLIIIGIIIIGTTQGGALINASRLASARSLTVISPIPKISGLLAWYEASSQESLLLSEIIDGDQVTTWFDISPGSIVEKRNSLTKTAGADVLYLTNGINQFPSIEFTGATGQFSLASLYQGPTSQATVFMVLQPRFTPGATEVVPFDANAAGNSFFFGIKSTALRMNSGIGVDTGGTNPANFEFGKNYVAVASFNNSSSSAYVNNVEIMSGNSTINTGTNSLVGLSIGSNQNNNSGFTGLISEIAIYDRPLKFHERKEIMKYLAKKYRIAVTGI
jgi:prepilin-type N-terminal cleavage/methylation domain-containing protein